MHKYVALALLLIAATQARKHHKHEDPFAALDHQLSHSLAFHYLWPWSQLVQAAAAMDDEDNLEEPQITSDPKGFEINMNVRRFKPEEIRVKVKNQYIIVEGRHRVTSDNTPTKFMANHFVQRFNLPPGTKQEEVKAVLKETGILSISAPRHEVPPPPPERIVPIEVRLPQPSSETPTETPTTTEKIETSSEKLETSSETIEATTEKIETSSVNVTPEIPVESSTEKESLFDTALRLGDKAHHVGKIRKKELKNTSKHVKDNEVSKGDANGLDYALIEAEE